MQAWVSGVRGAQHAAVRPMSATVRPTAGLVCRLTSVMLLAMRWVSLVFTTPSVAAAAGAASARTDRRRTAGVAAGTAAYRRWSRKQRK